MPEEKEFLSRWSKRKLSGEVDDTESEDGETTTAALGEEQRDHSDDTSVLEPDGNDEAEEVPAELAEIDIDTMDYDSDYTLFMKDNVPEALKRRALRQLWRSNPLLANVDGLNDYDDDFTDAALVVKGLQSAYKVGQGFLTDEELEKNRNDGEEDLVSEADDTPEGEPGETETAQTEQDDQEATDGDVDGKPDESTVAGEFGADPESEAEVETAAETEAEDTQTV